MKRLTVYIVGGGIRVANDVPDAVADEMLDTWSNVHHRALLLDIDHSKQCLVQRDHITHIDIEDMP